MSISIRFATENDHEQLNRYVDKHPEVPPFAYYEWSAIVKDAYKTPTYFFIAEDAGGNIKGVCATYTTKSWGGKRTLYSLKFGLLVDDDVVGSALLSHLQQFCRTEGIAAYRVTSGYVRCGTAIQPQVKKTVVMELAKTEEAMWSALRNKTRNMIRKAQNAGLTVEHGFQNLDAFYRIYVQRMLEKNVPIHSQCFFEAIAEYLKNQATLLAVKDKGKVVGGMVLLYGQQSAIYPYQASLREGEQLASNQLLIWEAMRWCRAKGIDRLDMGESKEGSPVYQSKVHFGGMPRDVYYYAFGDASLSKFSALLPFLFTYAPAWIKSRIGPWIKQQGRII